MILQKIHDLWKPCEFIIIISMLTVSSSRCGSPTVMVLLRLVESAELADGADPAVHLLLSFSHQVEGPLCRLDVKDEAVLKLLALEGEACVHLLAAVQVDDADGLFGMIALVILQHIRVSTHAATA